MKFRPLLAIAALVAAFTAISQPAQAHIAVDSTADCTGFTFNLSLFPAGPSPIIGKVDGKIPFAIRILNGPAGSVTYTWAETGVNPMLGGIYTYMVSWLTDGGGSSTGSFNADDCMPTATTTSTTTTAPSTTTTIASVAVLLFPPSAPIALAAAPISPLPAPPTAALTTVAPTTSAPTTTAPFATVAGITVLPKAPIANAGAAAVAAPSLAYTGRNTGPLLALALALTLAGACIFLISRATPRSRRH